MPSLEPEASAAERSMPRDALVPTTCIAHTNGLVALVLHFTLGLANEAGRQIALCMPYAR